MGKRKVTDFLIYRWRYPIGYGLFAISLLTLLVLAGLFIPGGLSQQEIATALTSDNLDPSKLLSLQPSQLIFLPYHLLQAASISLFGFNSFSIKLPSILLAFASATGIILLLRLWFRRNVAILTGIIAVTTGQFLLLAQSGHGGIMYIFWAVAILLTASLVIKQGKFMPFWVVIAFILAGFSLYIPLNIYVLLSLFITTIFHPHARHVILRRVPKVSLAIGAFFFILIILPLILGSIRDPSVIATLAGVPSEWGNIFENAKTILLQYASFPTPHNATTLQPVYSLGTFLLMLLGVYQLITTKYTTRSYIISFWLLLLLPFILLHPNIIAITFIPGVLLMGQAVDYLFRSWYRMFPRNPYARVFGLLPLGVLLVGIVISNIDRYSYGFHYGQQTYSNYNFDLGLLSNKLQSVTSDTPVTIITTKREQPLYTAYANHQRYIDNLRVKTSPRIAKNGISVVTHNSASLITATPTDVIAFKTTDDSDRFYLYKNTSN